MDLQMQKRRDPAMDIVRVVAVFTVLSVHFFLHNGFYLETVQGFKMYIAVFMRTIFSVCVPLFMLLTGYLMSKKTLSKKYYFGIVKTLIIFVLSTASCMIFKFFYNNEIYTIKDFILDTLDFTGADYSWYIEMYIGLFLLIPFINLAYNKLSSRKQKQALVLTFILLTIAPSLFNIFNFDSTSWWADPTISDEFSKLAPSWWTGIYPLVYYFTGCYLREYGIKLKTRSAVILLVILTVLFAAFNFYRSYGTTFKSGIYLYWYGFESYIMSVLLFVLLSRIKTEKIGDTTAIVLWKLSDLSLGIYLLSFIFDSIVYPVLNDRVYPMTSRLPFYFITVPVVFILSAAGSAVLNFIAEYLIKGFRKLGNFVKSQRIRSDKNKYRDYLFIALMTGGLIFSLWRCFYGFGGNDEAFYLTIPQRFIKGDAPIFDEWHLSQLSGFLLMPFVWIYQIFAGGTDGIIIAARFTYVLFHFFVTVVLYLRLKKYGYITVFAAFFHFIYTPFNIMALSYNTMGLDFVVLTGVLMGTADYDKKIPIILSGLFFAAAVLCCPYLAAGYILYAICVLIHILSKKNSASLVIKSRMFSGKIFLYFSVGVFLLAAVFLVFLLSKVSLKEIIESLPYLLSDPEHPQISIFDKFNNYFLAITECHTGFKYAISSYIAVLIVMIIDHRRKSHRSLYVVATACIVIFCYILFLPDLLISTYNAIMFPMIFMSITSYILCNNKPRELFASLFLLGIIYSVSICFASNQYFYVISTAISASNLAGFVFLAQLVREMRECEDSIEYAIWVRRASFGLIALMMIIQGAMQINVKANYCFWENGGPSSLNNKIESGPAKGIYTSLDTSETYRSIYEDIIGYNGLEKDNVLFLTEKSWCYLAVDKLDYGTFSAWTSGENSLSIERLELYYSVNPDKKPRYIYIPENSGWELDNVYDEADEKGYSVEYTGTGYKLEKIT